MAGPVASHHAQCNRSLQALQHQLVFFDNVYMYGKVDGVMTEETPFRPCSKKGEIRAEIATMLLNEIKAGNLTALIARISPFLLKSEEHTSELQSPDHLACRLLLEKKKKQDDVDG